MWLWDHVPYSQSEYHEGYRTDCSGFVSMVWRLKESDGSPDSLTTRTLYTVCSAVATSALQPGDAECMPGHHIFLFLRWYDASHTRMVTLEESGVRTGTTSKIRWVNDLDGYYPYRYDKIEVDPNWSSRPGVEFIEGANRFETAASASRKAYPTGAPVVVIASSESWSDAMGASALAGSLGGPILLVEHNSMPKVTMDEIRRLKAGRAVVVGGTGAIYDSTLQALKDAGVKYERVCGAKRANTAVDIASHTVSALQAANRTWDKTIFLSNSYDWPDALAAGPVAARKGWPILLTEGPKLSTVTSSAIASMNVKKVYILGGTAQIPKAVEDALKARGITVDRRAGSDRYETALAVARTAELNGMSWSGIAIVSGNSNADALAMGPVQARSNTFLLLSPGRGGLWAPAATAIHANRTWIRWGRTVGGEAVMNFEVRQGLFDALGPR